MALCLEKQTMHSAGRRITVIEAKHEYTATNQFQRTSVPREQSRSLSNVNSRGKKPTNEGPQCYKCKGFGHYVVVCPTKDKKLAFIFEKELAATEGEEDIETEEPCDDFDYEGEHLGASNLPSCIINRVLTGSRKELQANPEWLHTNIFHTRMEHNGRAMNVIIDNGSGMNVISETTIECLD